MMTPAHTRPPLPSLVLPLPLLFPFCARVNVTLTESRVPWDRVSGYFSEGFSFLTDVGRPLFTVAVTIP